MLRKVLLKRHHRAMEGDETGGSQPRVFEDTVGGFWMVTAPNNPHDGQVLASEFVAAVMGARLGAAIPEAAICELPDDLVAGLTFGNEVNWDPGLGYGSRLLPETARMFAPETHMPIVNGRALAAVVALDTLLGSHNGRQARAHHDQAGWCVTAVDFGHDIGPGNWNRSTLEAAANPSALEDPHGWLAHSNARHRAEIGKNIGDLTDALLGEVVVAIPPTWGPSADDRAALVSYLIRRRDAVATLMLERDDDEQEAQRKGEV